MESSIHGEDLANTRAAIVVGSGPAGMACALGILAAGKEVLMLDVGLTLEAERTQALKVLRGVPQEQWRAGGNSEFLVEGISADLSGVPLKLCYGSDYPYRSVAGATSLECTDAYMQTSLAYGGLSNVWGSSMLPYLQADMVDWPISQDQLAPHYRAVLEQVPTTGVEDELAKIFPLYTKPQQPVFSKQAEGLLKAMQKNKAALRKRGITGGASRIAVMQPCVQCGLCMYGCPHELIYSSAFTVEKLKQDDRFKYLPNVYVERVSEREGMAIVQARDGKSGASLTFSADRVFLGAGVLGTTTILLRSLEAYNTPVPILDSTYFLQPSLRLAGAGQVRSEGLHTLTQAFIEIMDAQVSKHTVHLQVYTYNELFERAMKGAAGPLHHLLPKDAMLGRLFLLQGFIHSSESAKMTCTLERSPSGDVLKVRGESTKAGSDIVRKIQKRLLSTSRFTGIAPILPLLRMGEPGRSFHTGGSFPMSASPGKFETDILGRPVGLSRVHAVDSSNFPSISATTITLTSMANAHRIGRHSWDRN